jgi:hypothetical protein
VGAPATLSRLVDAVDRAREAAVEDAAADMGVTAAAEAVGEHLNAVVEDSAVTHLFAALQGGYRGWHWSVVLTCADDDAPVTVSEVALQPGPDALVSPTWVPWHERLRPGDLGVGDLLPTKADDPRLVPSYTDVEDDEFRGVAFELGLGRRRVLSYDGRVDVVERWYDGERGPESPIARAAPAACATCGFFVPLAGAMRQAFGACANEYAPDDGKVVSVDHGCGAHSEAVVVPAPPPPAPPLVDEFRIDVVGGPLGHEPGSVADADIAEPLGHS